MRPRVAGLPPELTDLVHHLAACGEFWTWRCKTDGPWKRRTKALLKAPGARALVCDAVRELAAGGSLHDRTDPHAPLEWLSSTPTRDLAVGFTLAAGYLGGKGAGPEEIQALAGELMAVGRKNSAALDGFHLRDDELAGAAFTALGDLSAMDALWTLHREVPGHSHCHRALVRAVKKTATRLGVPPHRLAERTVPAHGLGPDGTVLLAPRGRGAVWVNVPYEALISLGATGRVTVDWTDIGGDGATTRTVGPFRSPRGFKERYLEHNVDAARLHAQGIEKTFGEERLRLRALLGEDRTWTYAEWARYYRDHPVTGVVARGLVWEHEGPDGIWTAGLPAAGGGFTGLDGTVHDGIPDAAAVRLWRPGRAAAEPADAVRSFLAGRGVWQPFDQAGAEVEAVPVAG